MEPTDLGEAIREILARTQKDPDRFIYYLLILIHEFIDHKSNWMLSDPGFVSNTQQILREFKRQINVQKLRLDQAKSNPRDS